MLKRLINSLLSAGRAFSAIKKYQITVQRREKIIMNKWNLKNTLGMLIYLLLYVIGTILVCMTGIIHPVFFVCYQITAGIVLTVIVIKAFDQLKTFGVAAGLSAGVIILMLVIDDAVLWHVIPIITIAAAAEIIRYLFKYSWTGNLVGAAIMTFSTFGYYAQIWFNRDYTYEHATEEMPAGYADTLMAVSPMWAFPVVIIAGIALSAVTANAATKLFKLEKK